MDRQEAIERLLDHYERPRNAGKIEDADAIAQAGHPECGDLVTVYLRIDAEGLHIAQFTFEGSGCSVSQASASILSEMMQHATFDQIDHFQASDMIDELGRELVGSRPRCAGLAVEAVKAALARYRREHQLPGAEL